MENLIDLPHHEIDYRDNNIRAGRIILIFRITLFFYFLMIPALLYLVSAAKYDYGLLNTDRNLILIQALISIINFPLIILLILFFLQWFQRSYYNLQQIPGVKTLFKPKWAVISWFIPIFNLVTPYLIMREIVVKNIAISEHELKTGRYKFQIFAWWILYIFGTYASWGIGIWENIYRGSVSPLTSLKWNIIFLAALIISIPLLIQLIQKINRKETEIMDKLLAKQ